MKLQNAAGISAVIGYSVAYAITVILHHIFGAAYSEELVGGIAIVMTYAASYLAPTIEHGKGGE